MTQSAQTDRSSKTVFRSVSGKRAANKKRPAEYHSGYSQRKLLNLRIDQLCASKQGTKVHWPIFTYYRKLLLLKREPSKYPVAS